MKKTKLIALVLCAAFMVMGAGYAYWQDTLVINNTVATGELNVKFTEATLTSEEDGTPYVEFIENLVADKELTLEVGNLYPGAAYNLNAKMKNVGTIPAVLHNVIVTEDMDGVLNEKTPLDDTQLAFFMISGTINTSSGKYTSTILPEHGVSLANLQDALNHDDIQLEPQETLTFDLTLTMDPDAEEEFENTYYKSIMELEFKQHNEL